MPWPLSQDYNEAIQTPAQCFAAPELQRGEAVTNALGLPMPCSGNFADVYAVVSGQHKWAVKCFTRQIQGLRERYAEISRYLQQVKLPFMVDFQFLEQGIRVRGQWYPILKMQWVEGLALNAFVKGQLDNPAILRTTSQLWAKTGSVLREANLAHGDLQHGNVLLVPGSKAGTVGLKLVDYDGMCVPALEMLKATEVGHPAYQHPQRLRDGTYGLGIDRFAHLVIYTALRALTVGGRSLWDRFDNGDNLLFTQQDFENPRGALVFQELLQLADPAVAKLVQALATACQKPVDQTPLLENVLPSGSPPRTTIVKQAAPGPGEPSPFVLPDTSARPRKKQRSKGLLVAALVGCSVMVGGALAAWLLSWPSPPTPPVVANDTSRGAPRLSSKAAPATPAGPATLRPVETRPTAQPTTKDTTKPPETKPPESPVEPKPLPAREYLTNSIGMKLVQVPQGKFTMGSQDREPPQHEVTISRPFYLGIYEVTQDEYERVMKTNPSHFKAVAGSDTKRLPVEQVSWNDATEFCRQLSAMPAEKKAGRVYRLPTEAEWEYACRAGTQTVFHYGDALSSTQANFDGEHPYGGAALGPKLGRPTTVGSYLPNAFGLYDMHGNVWEWCQDWVGPYPKDAQTDPQGPPTGPARVLRGGAWYFKGNACRAAIRSYQAPGNRSNHLGFRAVMAPEPEPQPQEESKPEPKPEAEPMARPQSAPRPGPKDPRLPVPEAAVLAEAREQVKVLFKEDYAKRKPADLLALASKLVEQAAETNDDPAARYTLLAEASHLAALAADAEIALEVMGQLAQEFAVQELVMKVQVLELVSKAASTGESNLQLADSALVVLANAVGADDYEMADRILQIAAGAASRSKSLTLTRTVQNRTQEVASLRKEFEQLKSFADKLAKNAEDPEANLAWGKYFCFRQRRWDKGLPRLVFGSDAKLKELAANDLSKPAAAAAQVKLADGWYDLAETSSAPAKIGIQLRAHHWYWQALPMLTGLARTRVEKRVGELDKLAAAVTVATHLPRPVTNSIGMKLACIPAGTFTMGSPEKEANRRANEGPQHKVRIANSFYIGVYEVKQSEYEKLSKNQSSFIDPSRPAENVTWDEAVEFCKKLSDLPKEKKAGRVYRLPTDAEWEYACRAGTTTVFHFGDSLSSKQANINGSAPYGGAEKGPSVGKTVPVGQYKPNAWGLYDMHGNVWEWVLDGPRTYTPNAVNDPRGPETSGVRIPRGGGWPNAAWMSRSALRNSEPPSARIDHVGFRVVFSTVGPVGAKLEGIPEKEH